MMTTAADVAKWMLEELEKSRSLYQEDAAYGIQSRFGKDFVYINDNGNLAIAKPVLKEFRKLTETTVVWERGERLWRKRKKGDPKSRQADD